MLKDMKERISVYSRNEKTALAISGITVCLFLLFTNYGDINALLRTHMFFDSVLDGTVMHYYDYMTSGNMHNANLLSRLPLMIWYLPSWIVTRLLGGGGSMVAYKTFYHQIWHKMFQLIMYLMCIRAMVQLCKNMEQDEKKVKYCTLLMAISPGVMISVFYAGQDEIVYIAFFMNALLHYVKGEWRKYYFWAVWSALCCQLMLLPYLLILLMDEKEWYVIAGRLMVPLIPQWLYAIFFSQCLTYRYTASDPFVSAYFYTSSLNAGFGAISILAVILMVIFAYSYLHKPDWGGQREKFRMFLLFCSVMFAALELFGGDQFYRRFLWVPFAVLYAVAFGKSKENQICLAVIMAADVVQSIRLMYQMNLVSNVKLTNVSAITIRIFGDIKYFRYPLLSEDSLGMQTLMLNSVIAACFFLMFLFRRKKDGNELELPISLDFVALLCSMALPVLLLYSFVCAYVTG